VSGGNQDGEIGRLGDGENKDKKEKIIRRIRDNGKSTSKTHYSNTPVLHCSDSTPLLRYSNTPFHNGEIRGMNDEEIRR
jgi:hypothetical protein